MQVFLGDCSRGHAEVPRGDEERRPRGGFQPLLRGHRGARSRAVEPGRGAARQGRGGGVHQGGSSPRLRGRGGGADRHAGQRSAWPSSSASGLGAMVELWICGGSTSTGWRVRRSSRSASSKALALYDGLARCGTPGRRKTAIAATGSVGAKIAPSTKATATAGRGAASRPARPRR